MRTTGDKKTSFFLSAKPIWPVEISGQMNYTVEFRAVFDVQKPGEEVLKLAASTLYRVSLNGAFIGYGPARAAEDYFRVDELELSGYLGEGANILSIEAVVYNAHTNYMMMQDEFLQAEVVSEGKVLASTEGEGARFEARLCRERVQKVPRYSLHRAFVEYYRLDSSYEQWKRTPDCEFQAIACQTVPEKKLLPRGVAYPAYALRLPVREVEEGTFEEEAGADGSWLPAWTRMVGRLVKGFTADEFDANPVSELERTKPCRKTDRNTLLTGSHTAELTKGEYRIVDFGTNLSGFLGASITAKEKTKLYFIYDELLFHGDVSIKRTETNTVIGCELEKGVYRLESIEAYTMKYLKIMVVEGCCEVSDIRIREYANPEVYEAHFSSSDLKLNRLFEGGRETLRQNAVDLLTDCPSRERGGYLCDSFFTARAAFDLTGNTKVERNFLENFLLADSFRALPEGMLQQCYPADTKPNYRDMSSPYAIFIPNWSLWFVVQLEEYLQRSGDRELIERLRPRVLKLFDYFNAFENEDGLLEKLDSWVFIEWSKANDYVQDVSYPSNMLYAGALAAAGRIYEMNELLERSDRLKKEINKQSYDGTFFADNAVRDNGELKRTANRSEVCQYYAFFFEIASPDTHQELWNRLVNEFGPARSETGAYPEVAPANAFIGNHLRLDLLSRYGLGKQLVDESCEYFMYMIEKTGTMWEHIDESASCNHGFASHIVRWLYKDALGISKVDMLNKTVSIRFEPSDLSWCEGRMPLPGGYLSVSWSKEDGSILYRIELPAGFEWKVDNRTGLSLVCK